MIGIYKITNLKNGLSYIGKSVNIQRRINEHRNKKVTKPGTIDYYIEKEGWDNFLFEVLEECQIEELTDKEIYYISFYDTYNNGYNLTLGGEGSSYGEANINAIVTEEDVINIRKAYNEHMPRKEVYKIYQDKIKFSTFVAIWTGRNWPHVMPEVFTNENKQWHISNSGHSRSYLTDEEVMQIRKDYINLTLKEIYQKYSNYSERCLRGIVSGENYKYLPLYKKQKKVWLNGGTY